MPTIKLYANLRKIAGTKELLTTGNSLGTVISEMIRRCPALDGVIVENEQIRPYFIITINGHNATSLDIPLLDQDIIAIFPPIAGG